MVEQPGSDASAAAFPIMVETRKASTIVAVTSALRRALGVSSGAVVAKSGIVGPGTDRTDVYRRGRKVIVSVDGHHTADAASLATQYVTALMADINGPVEFVADLRNISGFSSEGRKYWQDAFEHGRRRIGLITLVRATSLAKMAASTVGLYVGVKVRSVETLEEALRETDLATMQTQVDGARAGDSAFSDTPAPDVIHRGPCSP